MSDLKVTNLRGRTPGSAPNLPNGAVVTGVITATTFDGNATTATTATNASGLTGTPNIVVGSVTGTTGSFSGNVSVGGTLTYEDVTNVDSLGIITARSGIKIPAGGADFKGLLQEKVVITAGKLSDNTDINLDNGMVYYFTTTETSAAIPNITSSTGINTSMATGDTISVTIVTTAATAAFAATFAIDHKQVGVTTFFSGGSSPTSGGSSGKDVTALTIVKTGDATFDVLANTSNFA